jgi:hypothetical protein
MEDKEINGCDLFQAISTEFKRPRILTAVKILLHVHPLLGNVLVNKFSRRPILGKQSVAMLRNNR